MKCEIVEVKPNFKPFTINITVQSIDEAYELWHRFNVPTRVVAQNKLSRYPFKCDWDVYRKLWKIIDDKLKEITNV